MKSVQIENFPEYMVNYAYYGDADELRDEEIREFEDWRERNGYGRLLSVDGEHSFCSYPEFGLACEVVPVSFSVEERIQSSRQIKSGVENLDKIKEFEKRYAKIKGDVDKEEDLIQYYVGRYGIPEETLDEIAFNLRINSSRRPIKSGRLNVESEALEKVKQYGGKRINSKPIEILEILDDGEYSAFLVFTFKSGNDVYKMVYDYGFGGKKDKPSIKKIESSRKITSTRVNELTEQEKDDLYEVEKNEAEDYYNSLDDSDKRMLRARYGIKNVKDYVRFFIVHPNKLSDDYEFIIDPRIKLNSRRPIKSTFTPEEKHSIGDIDFYDVDGSRDREGHTFSCGGDLGDCWAGSAWYDSDTKQLHFGNAYFNSHRDMTDEDAKDYFSETISYYLDNGFNGDELVHDFCEGLYSSRQIKSARYIATDPETGEVLGSADTYDEAIEQWGEDVTITDSEVAEGQEEENMGLFQSRKSVNSGMQHKDVSNVSPDSWRDGSELPEKNFSNMSIEVFNQDGDEVFYDFEAKQWYYYPTHKKALVKKWVEKNLVNSSRRPVKSSLNLTDVFYDLYNDGYIYEEDENGYNMSYGEYAAISDYMWEKVEEELEQYHDFESAYEAFQDIVNSADDDTKMFWGYSDDDDFYFYADYDNGTYSTSGECPDVLKDRFKEFQQNTELERR